jgi:hypothetical protein
VVVLGDGCSVGQRRRLGPAQGVAKQRLHLGAKVLVPAVEVNVHRAIVCLWTMSRA